MANFTASRVSTERVRKLRFFEPRQYVSIDYARQDVLVIRIDDTVGDAAGAAASDPQIAAAAAAFLATGKVDPAVLAQLVAAGKIDPALIAQFAAGKIPPAQLAAAVQAQPAAGPAPGLSFAKPPVTPGEPLKLELLSFLDSVRTRRTPRVTARQGRDALALALEIQASMAAHAQHAGLQNFFAPGA